MPLCNGYGGPHFPKDFAEKEKWKAVIKKGVPGNKNKTWEPSPYDVVIATSDQKITKRHC